MHLLIEMTRGRVPSPGHRLYGQWTIADGGIWISSNLDLEGDIAW